MKIVVERKRQELTSPSRERVMMEQGVNKNHVLLAGVTTAAMAVAVVGHMFVIDWFGRKLREFVRPS